MKNKTIELWLSGEPDLSSEDGIVYLWASGSSKDSVYSVLDYVEANSEELRAKYLSFIHDMGNYNVKGKRIAEHLHLPNGHNLWWMSSISEKSHINSPRLSDCMKLLALEEILNIEKPSSVIVYGNDNALFSAIKSLCMSLKVNVSYEQIGLQKTHSGKWTSLYNRRPEFLSATLWLFRYLKLHWNLRNKKRIDWHEGNNSLTLFSYFYNLDESKCGNGEFYSRQWEILPEKLCDYGVKINWLHHFMLGPVAKDIESALNCIKTFNLDSEHQGKHAFFDSYLSYSIIIRACCNYLQLIIKKYFLSNIQRAFQPLDSAVTFWPLLKKEWISSIKGAVLLRNLLFIELVDRALTDIPTQKLGLYLQENQYWERALIHAWRRHGHGKLVGVPHATVNFWDMRYFEDVRTITSKNHCSQELPDCVALNGPVALDQFINAGYPPSKLVKVEALRYLHLIDKKEGLKQRKIPMNTETSTYDDNFNVIILGEIKRDVTLDMLHAIKLAVQDNNQYRFVLKTHPACPVNINDIDIPNLTETKQPLYEILSEYDLAIVSGSTSASIDVYYERIGLIVFLGQNDFNLSPVRGFQGVEFVRTADELRSAFSMIGYHKKTDERGEFFWLDNSLPRWQALIKDSGYHLESSLTQTSIS